jgi:hypothetical protein
MPDKRLEKERRLRMLQKKLEARELAARYFDDPSFHDQVRFLEDVIPEREMLAKKRSNPS